MEILCIVRTTLGSLMYKSGSLYGTTETFVSTTENPTTDEH